MEDCLDGCDDDGDGLVDCEDPDCSDYVCAPAPPSGWSGPLVLSPAGSTPACPPLFDGAASRTGDELTNVPPASCACTCGPASGATCTGNATLLRFATSDCSDTPAMLSIPPASACSGGIGTMWGGKALLAATPGTCTGTDTPTKPAPETAARALCEAARVGGGCGAGVCVAPTPPTFEPGACVVRAGDVACESSAYVARTVVYTGGIADERTCPACTCEAATGAACEGAVTLYTNGACSAPAGGVFLGTACSASPSPWAPSGASYQVTGIDQGSCAPTVASPPPEGAVAGIDPVTICCTERP
jgi:hypothetical protein